MGLGVALSGGGLKCISHIGSLKALEDLKVKIDYVSGASSGSMIAALYVLGYTTEEMMKLIKENYAAVTRISRKPIFKLIAALMIKTELDEEGLIPGEKIEELVDKYAADKGVKNISDIKIPFALATVDTISTKECIIMSKDIGLKNDNIDYITNMPIGKAVRASMSFSGILTTCNFEKYNFIDGATKNNLPTEILQSMGADKILGINFKLGTYNPSKNIFEVLLRTIDIFSMEDVKRRQKIADLAIEVDTFETSLLNTGDIDKCYNAGYDTIMEKREEILKLLQN